MISKRIKFKPLFTLTACFLLPLVSTHAQIQKGDMYIGGSLYFTSGKNQWHSDDQLYLETKWTSISLGLNYSYMLSDRLDIVAGFGFQHFVSSTYPSYQGSGNEQTTKFLPSFPVSVTGRYLFKINSKLYPSIDLTSNYSQLRSETNNNGGIDGTNNITSTDINQILDINIGPGLTYLFSEKWSARAHLGVFYYQYSNGKSVSSNGIEIEHKLISESFSIFVDGFTPHFSFFYKL